MPTIEVTRETGGRSKSVVMTNFPPEISVTDDELAPLAPKSGDNGPFFADLLSQFLMHERAGVHLYKALHARTTNPMLQSTFKGFQEDSERNVASFEELVTTLGGDPNYVSPAARMTEFMDSRLIDNCLLDGSLEEMGRDQAQVEAVLVASAICRANCDTLRRLVDDLPDAEPRRAISAALVAVEPSVDAHMEWASTTRRTLVVNNVEHPAAAKVGEIANKVVGKVKDIVT
jgi:hypothetical protein